MRAATTSSLWLPEGDLAAGGRGNDAAPADRSLAGLEHDRAAEHERMHGGVGQVRDLDIGEPDGVPRVLLGDSAFDARAEVEGQIRGSAGLDPLRTPAEELRILLPGKQRTASGCPTSSLARSGSSRNGRVWRCSC